ncbi:hypothetical protein [Lachnoclostridium phytofermentans]|uniref:hypothetical protein n=1 Tax=Lachnoclostridium phytofermentans TaxID=66219 RepID=UPI000A3EAC9B|nr:hypothetical protein [Lachnoclostridium phytofermentans]
MNKLGNITKTKSFSAFTSALLAIVLGLIFGFFIMLVASPSNAVNGFRTVLTGGFKRIGDVFYFATPILMTGLAVGFAFKMGLFNIGASGQYTMGMFFHSMLDLCGTFQIIFTGSHAYLQVW